MLFPPDRREQVRREDIVHLVIGRKVKSDSQLTFQIRDYRVQFIEARSFRFTIPKRDLKPIARDPREF